MNDGPAAIVCGFSDLAAGLGGLAWELGSRGGLVLSDNSVREAEIGISREGEDVRLEMRAEDAQLEVALTTSAGPVSPHSPEGAAPPGGPLQEAICSATVRFVDWGRTFQCAGHLSSWAADPLDGAGRFRHLAIEGPGGSLLLLCARGEAGEENHGAEDVGAWLLDPEGGLSAFDEALLSTQFDDAGRQTRAGLELWPAGEDQSVRAAAVRAAGTRLGGLEEGNVSAALMRCSTEGTEGLGSYLICGR
jgi:hypothetical protein